MTETLFTTNRAVPYPTGKDFVTEGPAEMQAIATAVDVTNTGDIDYLQAGVALSTDWSFTAKIENSATCTIESTTTTGGVAWLPLTAIGLTRSATTAAKLKTIKPSSLPGTGKYLTVGFELTPTTWGAAATVSVVSGAEQTTQKLAEEHSPAITAGKGRIRDVVILNTAGVYSIASQTERRLWATGGEAATETVAEGRIGKEKVKTAQLANEAVTSEKIKLAAIIEGLLGVEAVSESKIKNLAITAAKIAEGTITTVKIKAEAITTALLASEAVTEAKIAAKAVSDAKVATNRALVTTSNSYSGVSFTEPSKKIKPSATRFAFVNVYVYNFSANGSINAFGGTINVGGKEVTKLGGELREPAQGKPNYWSVSFMVPPNQEWEFVLGSGSIQENDVIYSTLLL